jgi:DNA-directed RNA polymerase specialized sigma24 family protein
MTMLKRQSETKKQELEPPLPCENLYHQYHLRIYRYLRAHLKNDDDAADLTQQVFFQVWMRLPTYQPAKGSFSTWLFSIARHRLIDFLRAMRSSTSWETLYEIAISPPGRGVAATGSAGTAGSRLFVSPLSGIISF